MSNTSPTDGFDRPAVLSALHWHWLCEAELTVTPTPRDWYHTPERSVLTQGLRSQASDSPPRPIAPPRPTSSEGGSLKAMAEAREAAEAAQNFDQLTAAIREFSGCDLKQTATHTVTHDGNPDSGVMFIGEAPGYDEDIQGKPFVGRSGQLLDKMLVHIDLPNREHHLISNVLYWRPPGNRTPTDSEVDICRPFFEKMIALVNPAVLVALGGRAVTALLKTKQGISSLRGRPYDYHNEFMTKTCPMIASFHPSYLLRVPQKKQLAWHDMLLIKQKLLSKG